MLTPGVANSAYFEHALLARLMGVDLVEGRDLICRDDVCYVRTTAGEERVDVIYRRIDDDFIDPLQFRPDSLLGCAGLVHAARAGNVTIANAIGNGVADDKLTYTYVPDLVEYYLGEAPLLRNVDTYRLEDEEVRPWVMDRLDQMVLKPVDASGGYGLVFGPSATDEELEDARRSVERQSPRLHRPADRHALDGADARRRSVATPPPRPAPVRGERRRAGVGAARRAHPGRPAGGQPGRELEPGRRLQGHLGRHRSAPVGERARWPSRLAPSRPRPSMPPVPLQFGPADDLERHQQQLQQQQSGGDDPC